MEKRILVSLAFLVSLFHGTALFGDIYDADTFTRLDNTRIRIEGPVSSQLIASGNYSIDLPPGNYTIIASYFRGGRLDLYAEERVSISDREVRFDLVLLPYALQNFIPNDPNGNENETTNTSPEIHVDTISSGVEIVAFVIVLTLFIVVLAVYFAYRFIQKTKKIGNQAAPVNTPEKELIEKAPQTMGVTEPEEPYYLDPESRKFLEIIKSQGGRMLQKELRDITKMSESAMSLMLSELESVGYVKRFKRGRENLVKLVKEPES